MIWLWKGIFANIVPAQGGKAPVNLAGYGKAWLLK